MQEFTVFTFLICVSFVIVFGPTSTTAIQCWTCSSYWDTKCEPIDTKSTRRIDCDKIKTTNGDKPTLCKKVRGFDFIEKAFYVERGCADNGHTHSRQPGCRNGLNPTNSNEETTCFCENDLCNGSRSLLRFDILILTLCGAIACIVTSGVVPIIN